jgi:hypothetical protein
MPLDTTSKDRGRVAMDELCVNEVKDDRIVFEQSFDDRA